MFFFSDLLGLLAVETSTGTIIQCVVYNIYNIYMYILFIYIYIYIICIYYLYIYIIYIYICLEPSGTQMTRLFLLERALFWRVEAQK